MGIQSVHIKNFKSIRDSGEVQLNALNVLIGANGAGKSNFISFFKFLKKLFEQELQLYINQHGRVDNFLYFGRKKSDFLAGTINFYNGYQIQYSFELVPDQSGSLIFSNEMASSNQSLNNSRTFKVKSSSGSLESQIREGMVFWNEYLKLYFSNFKVFHFHDTSENANVKQPCLTTDYAWLQEDGGNLAAFLYRLQESHAANFRMIEQVVRSIAPFFNRFFLQPDEINPNQIYLRWLEKGSEQLFTAHQLSDGTLRMICLAALLLQPSLPGTIIIDEPELGLHPFAVQKLAAMLKSAAQQTQVIISTQSVNLVDEFDPEDIIIVDRQNDQTVFRRLEANDLTDWMADYSLGQLWDKNVIGGRP